MQLVTACSYPLPGPATLPSANLDLARSGLAKMALGSVAAAGFSFAGGLYGETFIFLTAIPQPGRPSGTLRRWLHNLLISWARRRVQGANNCTLEQKLKKFTVRTVRCNDLPPNPSTRRALQTNSIVPPVQSILLADCLHIY